MKRFLFPLVSLLLLGMVDCAPTTPVSMPQTIEDPYSKCFV